MVNTLKEEIALRVEALERLKNFELLTTNPRNGFVLTGSRYFGISTPVSDFDYFISKTGFQSLGLNEEELYKHFGMARKPQHSTYSGDPSVYEIWEIGFIVDIQVIWDDWYSAKIYAQCRIMEDLRNNMFIKPSSTLWSKYMAKYMSVV